MRTKRAPSGATPSRSSRRGRRALTIAAGTTAVAIAAVAWLLRDPEPVFQVRQGTLVAVESLPSVLDGGTREQEIRLESSSGLRVTLAVRRSASPGTPRDSVRRQLFVILGGQVRGKGAVALAGDPGDAVFASLDYPYDGDRSAQGPAVFLQAPAIRRALYDTPPALGLALDYLLTRGDVDPARVELVGASFGVPFATIAAARDARVSRLWLAHGGGKPFTLIEHNLRQEVGAAAIRWPVAGLITLLASGPRFAPERWIGRVSPRPVVMLNATEDEQIPQRSVESLWTAAREPRELVWLPGQHMRGSRPEVLRAVVDSVRARARLPAGR